MCVYARLRRMVNILRLINFSDIFEHENVFFSSSCLKKERQIAKYTMQQHTNSIDLHPTR